MTLKNTLFSSCLQTKAILWDTDLLLQHLLLWILPVNIHVSKDYIIQSTVFAFILLCFTWFFFHVHSPRKHTQTDFLEIAFLVTLILMLNAARNKAKGQHFLPKEGEHFCAVRNNCVLSGKPKGGPKERSLNPLMSINSNNKQKDWIFTGWQKGSTDFRISRQISSSYMFHCPSSQEVPEPKVMGVPDSASPLLPCASSKITFCYSCLKAHLDLQLWKMRRLQVGTKILLS